MADGPFILGVPVTPATPSAIGPLLSAASGLLSSLTGPYERDASYAANRVGIRATPPPDQILRAYWAGRFGTVDSPEARAIRDTLLAENGISGAASDGFIGLRGVGWQSVIDLSRPVPPFELMKMARWYYDTPAWKNELEIYLSRAGINRPDHRRALLELGSPLGASTVVDLYHRGLIDRAVAYRLLRVAGILDTDQLHWLLEAIQVPGQLDLVTAVNRGLINAQQYDDWLKLAGFGSDSVRAVVSQLRYEIPGPSDLIRFGLREVWDELTVQRWGYDEDLPDGLSYWLGKQGLSWTPSQHFADVPAGGNVSWDRAYWRAHWEVLSPHQAYSVYHLLREGRWQRFQGLIPGVQEFSLADLKSILKIHDYPKKVRDNLAALAFRPLGVREIRQGVATRSLDRSAALEHVRDLGFLPDDAEQMVKTMEAQRQKAEDAPLRRAADAEKRRTINCTLELYDLGGLDRNLAETVLRGTGLAPATAQQALMNRDTCRATGLLKEVIHVTRTAFLRGEIPAPEAARRLALAGVLPARIADYLRVWAVQFTPRRKELSTQRIIHLVARGLLPPVDALARLTNLGWSNPDALLQVADGEQKLQQLLGAQERSKERTAQQAASQLQKIAKAHEIAARQALAIATKLEPLSVLKRWLKKGVIDQENFAERLRSRGYDRKLVSHYIEDVTGRKPSDEQLSKWFAGPAPAAAE